MAGWAKFCATSNCGGQVTVVGQRRTPRRKFLGGSPRSARRTTRLSAMLSFRRLLGADRGTFLTLLLLGALALCRRAGSRESGSFFGRCLTLCDGLWVGGSPAFVRASAHKLTPLPCISRWRRRRGCAGRRAVWLLAPAKRRLRAAPSRQLAKLCWPRAAARSLRGLLGVAPARLASRPPVISPRWMSPCRAKAGP